MGFSEEEIAVAKRYKYNGKDDSIFVKLFYRKFWDWAITFMPIWIAPNLITLIGFFFELFSFALSFYYSDGLAKPMPSWVCFVNGISLFIYQLMDNLDGRQARRTGSSSPLGQFFDHGCDAITGVSELFKVAASFNLGVSKKTFYFIFLMGFGFFFTSWEEYVTHRFYLGPINGPDEGLTLIWIGHIVVGFFPELHHFGHSTLVKIIFIISVILTVGGILLNVIRQAINNKQITKTAVLSSFPCIISTVIFVILEETNKTAQNNVFFIMSAGYLLQYGAQVLITSFLVGRSPIRLFNIQKILLWAVAIAVILSPQIGDYPHFWTYYYFAIVGIMLVYDIEVITGLSKGLEIHPFKIKPKQQQ